MLRVEFDGWYGGGGICDRGGRVLSEVYDVFGNSNFSEGIVILVWVFSRFIF